MVFILSFTWILVPLGLADFNFVLLIFELLVDRARNHEGGEDKRNVVEGAH